MSIDFVKYIPKSLFLGFSSFQTVHNLVGQKRPPHLLCFILPKLTLSLSLWLSPEFITDDLLLLAESKQRRDCRAQLQGTIAERFLFQFRFHSNFNFFGAAVEKLFA